ncbi:MAG: LamG domain-containing protein, partial [Verrucomicrobiales bacterium]|nr:LamG domain-containing protein [Verrucomicrobiales bacterium]
MPRTPTHPACFLLVHGYLLQRFRHVTAPFRRMLSRSCALVVLGLSLGSTPLRAGLTVDLHTYRGQWGFVTYGWLSTNALSPAPAFGHYLIRSPHYPTNGSVLQYEMGAAGLTFLWGSGAGVSTFNEFMVGLTNGPWTIQFTNNTTTNVYTFTVTATGLSSNLLRPPIITYPQDGDPDVPSNPTFTWTEGPIGWHGTLEVELYGSQFNFNQFDSLSPTQTNWTSPVPLPPENYNFHVTYRSNATPTIVASTPLDGAMNPLGGWVSTANIEVSDSTYFTVAPPGSPVGQVGLIAHYRFDDAMNLGLDSSTNGFDLNVGGAWNSGTVGYDTNAVAGPGAALFSAPDTASGAFLSWNPTPAAILSTLASNFSVSVWIKTTLLILPSDSPPAEMGIVTADVLGVTNDVTPVALGAGQVAFNTGGDADHTTYSSSGVANGVYHHVVVTRDALNGRKRIYVNGVLETTEFGQTGLLNAPQLAALGAFLDASESNPAAATPGNGYDGWLDDVQIYAGILSSNQVAFLYAHPGQVAPSETNPPVEVELELSITRHRSHDLSEGYICF